MIASAAVALWGGCYGGKLIKMPINAEHSSLRADTLRAQQLRMLRLLADLQEQIDEEREARVRFQAQNGVTLSEIEESVRILSNRIEDRSQLLSGSAAGRRDQRTVRPDGGEPGQPADTTGGAGTDSTESLTPISSERAAEVLYRASYMDLTRGNYDLAIEGFKNYLVRHPAGLHLPEVHYYLGECYYAGDRHLEAVGEFQYVVREFPESRLVAAAYLKSGLCYYRLEENNLAEKAFRELIAKHPNTEEAQQARDALTQFDG